MLTKIKDIDEKYIANCSAQNNEQPWMIQSKLDAFRKFKEIKEYPSLKYGTSIVMDTSGLDLENLNHRKSFPQSDFIYNKEVTAVLMSKADESIKEYLGKLVPIENKFLALHYSLFEGLIIIVPNGKKLENPFKIATFLENDTHFNHFLIIVGDDAEIDILEDAIDYGKKGFKTNVVEMFIGKNSKVNYIMTQKLNDEVYNLTTRRAVVGKDSKLNWLGCTLGSKFSQIENTSIIAEEGAESNNYGIFIGMNEEQFDLYNNVRHEAPNTNSEISTRGIVKDKS